MRSVTQLESRGLRMRACVRRNDKCVERTYLSGRVAFQRRHLVDRRGIGIQGGYQRRGISPHTGCVLRWRRERRGSNRQRHKGDLSDLHLWRRYSSVCAPIAGLLGLICPSWDSSFLAALGLPFTLDSTPTMLQCRILSSSSSSTSS